MTMRSLVRNVFNRPVTRTIRTAPHRLRPALEALEHRWVRSTIVVNNFTDAHVPGQIDLREAIASANAASEATTIQFAPSYVPIILQGTTGGANGLELTNKHYAVTIQGPTDSLIVEASDQTGIDHINHIFYIGPLAHATISNLWIVDGFDENPADGGGGMLNYGTVSLTNCNFNRNVAYRGAGLVNAGSASLTKCSLSGNTVVYGGLSSDVGGAIFNGYSAAAYYGPGTVSLTDCTISGNYANQNGGGLYNDQHSKAYLSNCTLSKNIAGDGGGLFNKGKAILSNCTLSGNAVSGIAAGHGGGLYNGGAATLINCTVSGNTGDDGGGLFNSGTAALTNCTVSSNKISGSGGGLYNNANVSLTNTIVAGNTADSGGSDVYNNRSLTSLGYNLIGERDGTSGWTKTDLTGTVAKPLNPKLAPLGNNGGPTQTMALLSGSPAIGKGTRVSGVTTDQRGFPLDRPTPDIGAFQSQNVQSTGNQRAVQALYLAALGRAGSVAELDGWASLLPAGATSLTRSVAAGIEGSPEARDHLVQAWYATYLGRQARGGEEQGFVNLLQAGQNEERVLSLVLGSTEYFNRAQALVATGTPRERFVQSLYHLLLGRTAGADEVSGWVTALQGHALTPQGVAFAFLGAPEYRTFVVSDYYDGLLHRLAARKEISGWVNPGLDHFHLRIGFESSGEFFSNG